MAFETFSAKNHDYDIIIIYKIVFCFAVNTRMYLHIFRGLDAYGGRKLRTDTHTRGTTTVTIIIKVIRSAEAHTYAKLFNMKRMR